VIDVEATVRDFLARVTGITDLTGQKIYASTYVPAGYKPGDGQALLFGVRGGGQDYSSHVVRARLQFMAFGASAAECRELDRALFDGFNDVKDGDILWTRLEVPGVLLRDPETEWPYVLSFYEAMVRT
jgi:hypothetical protein